MQARGGDFDLIVVSLGIKAFDGLRLCSHLRSLPEARNTPILVLVSDGESRKLAQALDMGVNDYLMRPVDRNELIARVRTQLRKKLYAEKLRQNMQLSLEMAITDQLTGLHNRHYMARHLDTLMKNAAESAKPISFLIMDIDYFKSVNDTYGHDSGDEVLQGIRHPHLGQRARHRSRLPFRRRGIRGGDARYRSGLRLHGGRTSAPDRWRWCRSASARPPHSLRVTVSHRHGVIGGRRRHAPRTCCTAPTRRSIAPSAKAGTGSSPKPPNGGRGHRRSGVT